MKRPTTIEIPPDVRTRVETVLRAAIPSATKVRLSITRRTEGTGSRLYPWQLTIAVDHPGSALFGTHVSHDLHNVYSAPEEAIAAIEPTVRGWLRDRADGARGRHARDTRLAEDYVRSAAAEMREAERLDGVLAAYESGVTR